MKSPAAIESHLDNRKNCILVPPSSPEKLAEEILFLKNNPEERKKISTNGYQTYLENLSMKKVGIKLVKLIEKLMSSEP